MSRALKVMHVIEAMHQGGAESLVVEHVRHAGPGVESTVCALNRGGPALEQARALGASVDVLRRPGRAGVQARAGGLLALARRMREERIDVVNGHNPTGALYAVGAAALAGVHAVLRTEHSLHYPGRHSAFYPWLERLATHRTAAVVCVCEAVRESHVRRMGDLASRFVTIMNGVDELPAGEPGAARAAGRAALGLAPEDLCVLSVGSLTRQKAHHVLIDAFARVAGSRPRARLLIAGEGPLRAALEERIAAVQAPAAAGDAPAGARASGARVRLLGAREDVGALMQAADLYALSSEREGLSVTLLEAMRAGRAAVATRVGGNGEAIAEGTSGRLVPVDDVASFAEALASLLDDRARREAMGHAARERFLERFTAERMVAETEALYRRALGGPVEAPLGAAGEGRHATA